MTANRFGGGWTQDKLAVLSEYLDFYRIALSRQKYKLLYIDAFAGTGRCRIRSRSGGLVNIEGSAKIALDTPGFYRYRFIESNRKHQEELQYLVDQHPNGHLARIAKRSAEDVLPEMLLGYDWSEYRGVLFLDPFGLQCTYRMLEQIAATKALDVFFLVNLSGLYRNAAIDVSAVDEGKAAKLTSFLGTDEWRSWYAEEPQLGLFSGPRVSREHGWEQILAFTTKQLRTLFPYVGEPNLMGMDKGPPLFALYFAVSNDSPKARGLAAKVSREILSKLRR